MAAANKGLKVHTELAQQFAFLLRSSAITVQLLDELIPTFPKDEKLPVRMEGLKGAYSSLTTMYAGAETSLSEKRFYSANDLSLLLDAMAETVPTVKKAFLPDYKIELRKQMELHRAEFPRPQDKQDIQKVIDTLGSN